MDTKRLRHAFSRHVMPQTLQGLYGPLAVTFLLLGVLVCVALLLIIDPLAEQMIHDPENLLRHHITLAHQACCEVPEGASQKRRGLAPPTHIAILSRKQVHNHASTTACIGRLRMQGLAIETDPLYPVAECGHPAPR